MQAAKNKSGQLRLKAEDIETHLLRERTQAAKNIQEFRNRIAEIESLLEKEEVKAREKASALQNKLESIEFFVESSSATANSFSSEVQIQFLKESATRKAEGQAVLSDEGLPALPLKPLFSPLPAHDDSTSSSSQPSKAGG